MNCSLGDLRSDDGNANENVTLRMIISTRSTFEETANYPGTKLVGVAFK